MGRYFFVYIMATKNNKVLYVGVTNNLQRRICEHKSPIYKSFTGRYNVNKLVYFEVYEDISIAIAREKQLKAGSRKKKVALIEGKNPQWEELLVV